MICATFTICGQNKIIDSLQIELARHTRDTNEIRVLGKLAAEFTRTNTELSRAYFYRQITLARTLNTNFGLSNAYSSLVTNHQHTGRIDSATYYLNLMEAHTKNFPADKKAKILYASTAGLFYKNQGKTNEALPYLLEGLNLLSDSKDKTEYAGQMLNVGNAYYRLGKLKNAAEFHLKSLSLFEEIGNKRGQSFCLNSLGNDFLELKQYKVAENYFIRSSKMKHEMGDSRGELSSWMNLGIIYQQTGKYKEAKEYFNKTLLGARQLKLSIDETNALFNLGSLLKTTKNNDEAKARFLEALTLARQGGDSALVARIKTYLVAIENDVEREDTEETTLMENIKISMETGDISNTAEGYLALAEWYASRKKFDKAFENLNQGMQLGDSLRSREVVLQMKTLEEQYESEKKQREIELLKKDQELQALALSRERTNVLLIGFALFSVIVISILLVNRYRIMNQSRRELELEKVRNHIARDLHDDIGSTLSSINIMSQLAMNGDAKDHLHKIALHSSQMMENMSDIVWSINPKNDTLEQVVLKMKEFAFEILEPKEITHTFQIDSDLTKLKLDVEKRKNLFLIFKEAINNAAKYSGGSNVSISLSVTQHKIQLSIIDNGKGFNEEVVKRGNGLINMKERASSIGGQLSQKSQPGNGTEIHLDIPIT
jgi:two-component system, NarL family, sensor histidine kinase UhpB